MANPVILAIALLWTAATHPLSQAQGRDGFRWYAGGGAAIVQAAPAAADFGQPASATRFSKNHITFPHLVAGFRFESLAVEGGYRKLGVLAFKTANAQTKGQTHSNAVGVSVLLPMPAQPHAISLYGKATLDLVRTVTIFERRQAAFPVEGGKNVLQLVPSVGLGLAVSPASGWTLRAEANGLLKKTGDAPRSGRYSQRWLGIDLVRGF